MQKDAVLIETNPLIIDEDDEFLVLDAKMSFDDSALFRHPEILALRDLDEEDNAEIEAKKHSLSYVKLDGNIGCMVNGAGLAMGTMDAINFAGGKPANFLDVGGLASSHTVAKAFEIILKDEFVKVIFINIFGGIVRCDRIANGIIEAINLINPKIPIVIRLDGTNAKEAEDILKKANILNLIPVKNLEDGAILSVKLSKEFNKDIK
ncbi:succinyl-CoA synthetase subunit beta [Campylobacter ureolyticus]|nr:succinyl-CoA synthetase subunit beta [Campylobacter ureolyticus]